MKLFEIKLTRLFEEVEPKFREETIARYKRVAVSQYESWVERMRGEEPTLRGQMPRYEFESQKRDIMRLPQYVRPISDQVKRPDFYSPTCWADLLAQINDGKYEVDFDKAVSDANASVTSAKQHFISKQSKKLTNACKLRKDVKTVEGYLSCNGVVTGQMTVRCRNGDQFTLTMNMIVNHRYTRGYTSFYQYPARFGAVVIGDWRPSDRISEKWMMENFTRKPT